MTILPVLYGVFIVIFLASLVNMIYNDRLINRNWKDIASDRMTPQDRQAAKARNYAAILRNKVFSIALASCSLTILVVTVLKWCKIF